MSAQPLAGGALAVMAASALFVLSGYVIHIALGRTLGPVGYGLFGVAIGLVTVVNSLQAAAIPRAIARYTAERAGHPADLLLTGGVLQLATGVALGVALLVLAGPLASAFGDQGLTVPFQIVALALPPYALFSLLWGFNGGQGRYSRQAIMLSLHSVARTILAVGLGLLFALPGAVLGYVIAPVVGILAAGVWRTGRGRLLSPRLILSYSAPLLLLAFFSIAHLNVDLFFVKALAADPASAGYYTVAQNIARVPHFLTTGLGVVLLPAVARAAAGNPTNARALVRDVVRFGFLMVAPLAALLVGTADDLVPMLYGDAYEPGTGAMMLLSPAMAFFALAALVASLLAGVGHPSHAVAAAGTGLLTTGILCTVLLPTLGMQGAAVATLLGTALALSIAVVAAVRVFSFSVPWPSFARSSAASAVVAAAAFTLNGTAVTVVGIPALALGYGALLIAFGEIRAEDRIRLRRMLPGRLA